MPAPRVDDEDLFRKLFETAPDAMIVVDRAGSIVLANPQADRLFGYAPGELVGMCVESLLPECARATHTAHRADYNASPRVRPMGAGHELTGVRRDGRVFPLEIALSPVGNGLYAASVRDISESQRARQALRRAERDGDLAELGRQVLESSQDGSLRAAVSELVVKALDVDGVAVAVGLPGGNALPIRSANGIDADMLDALGDAFTRDRMADYLTRRQSPGAWLLANEPAGALPALREALAAHGFADAAIVPLLDRHEATGALLALVREPCDWDVDRLGFLQLAANMLASAVLRGRSQEQLAHAQRLDALGQLTGGIAHDFNNLLTVVSGNLQILDAEYGDVADARELIDGASRAVDRCVNLTRKLLGFSRRRTLTPRGVRPQQVFDDLGQMLARTLGSRIDLRLDCPAGTPPVYADPGELEAALVNLAINARDAMPGGGTLHMSARARTIAAGEAGGLQPGEYVVFLVEDTGTGMTQDVLDHALEPFFTTKDAGKGSGLGLSMVYGFVRQSGGRVAIGSQPGRGTRVEILLPTAPPEDELGEARTPGSISPGHARVLVVEDEPGVRKVVVRFLHALGYDTLEAGDGARAMALLRMDRGIQLLFSDVSLGSGTNGFELVREARRLRPGLPALLTSGYERTTDGAEEALESGVELLRKPYRREQLGEALAKALEGRQG
ncbi:PAS domain-containing hybrid sensor histidine kinase/response regulator [Frateuria soli]|uniref:PAS domain-containing hybrid sensor histidine kinase/response regulator n=1 Tax=Frateuria soli TaxID=1542730 RepID=UPI001E373479|nr:PAS domain-containing hybrid sensor histidine kinase/response regulator [Frateuria soli]UGB39607.1 PAS domain S-box protein [Frateuria soli]